MSNLILIISIWFLGIDSIEKELNNFISSKTETPQSECYKNDTKNTSIKVAKGANCGSKTSLNVTYTNLGTDKIRVAFYIYSADGSLSSSFPKVKTCSPGETIDSQSCNSNGKYKILTVKVARNCAFPDK